MWSKQEELSKSWYIKRQQTRIFITGYKKVWNEYCYKCIDVFRGYQLTHLANIDLIAKASTMALYQDSGKQ